MGEEDREEDECLLLIWLVTWNGCEVGVVFGVEVVVGVGVGLTRMGGGGCGGADGWCS